MFKPLLKTLPSLSGNMKIACKLDGYKKVGSNIYECFVNEAYLVPLSHNLYDQNIKLNLKNNSFEYDVKEFFEYYSDIFYKTNFTYSKVNIPIIDFTSVINDTNKDFQYGCKRVSYLKSNGNQFAFYAPIYAENIDDLKDKTFRIKIVFQKTNILTRYIDIHISSSCDSVFDENYLIDYIERYYSKIDNKVIYCSPSYKNMYYGINLVEGGFIRVEDNISSNIYKKYYTINDFDCILNNGFKRNSLMMKQIFNLSFYFNPFNLLTTYEQQLFKNCILHISGAWYDKDDKLVFYDFSDNYNLFRESIYKYYNNILYSFNTDNNIMNMNYPGFNESTSENFKYINTVAKNYNRWKLKYSSDTNPYITNLNFAFSLNQDSLYTYKEFPQYYTPLYCNCSREVNTKKYNLKYGDTKEYTDLFNEKFISSFFNLLVKEDQSKEYINIFDSKYDNFWGNVDTIDNKLYHQGILYDFNKLYQKYNIKDTIDKFSIFVIPEFTYISSSNYNDKYKTVKFLYDSDLNKLEEEGYENLDYEYINDYLNTITNYVTIEKSINGEYIYNNQVRQYTTNCYYDINDLKIKLWTLKLSDDSIEAPITFESRHKYALIDGYKLLDICWSKNIISNLYKDIIDTYNLIEYGDEAVFRIKKFKQYDPIYTLYDKLYFSIYPSKTKYNLLENYSVIGTDNKRINLYYKTKFIKSDIVDTSNYDFSNIPKYYYSNGLYDHSDKIMYTEPSFIHLSATENNYGEYFDSTDSDKDIIYVDVYNLTRVLHEVFGGTYTENIFEHKECLAKFLNKEHINSYFEKLHKEASNMGSMTMDQILDTIYIDIRLFNNVSIELGDTDLDTIYISHKLYNLRDYGINNLKDINTYINYNYHENYFYFTENWIKDNSDLYDYQFKILRFDLVFKRKMYIMNDILYNLIINNTSEETFRDLFLYHIYNPDEYKYEMTYCNNLNNTNISTQIDWNTEINNIFKQQSYDFNLGNDNIFVIPYFNSIYEEEKIDTKIYYDYFINNIYKMVDGSYHYRHNLPNLDIVYKNENEIIKSSELLDKYIFSELTTIDKESINNILENHITWIPYLLGFYNFVTSGQDPYFQYSRLTKFETTNSDNDVFSINILNKYHYIQLVNDDTCKVHIIKEKDIETIYDMSIYKNGYICGTIRNLFEHYIPNTNIQTVVLYLFNGFYYLLIFEWLIDNISLSLNNINDYENLIFQYINQDWNNPNVPIESTIWHYEYGSYQNSLNYQELFYKVDPNNRYSRIKTKEDSFMTYSDLINSGIIGDNNNMKMYDNNLITYTMNGYNYGFYIIKSSFDNTKNTLNIINDKGNEINTVDYINGIDVSLINEFSYSYLAKIYKNLLPYINNSNLVNLIYNSVDVMIKPNIYNLYNKYKQYPNKKKNKIVSYTIYNSDKKYDIELLRYFDEIVPYIPQAKGLTSYFLYYKNTKNIIENNLTAKDVSYIMYSKNISISSHTNPIYFNYINDNIKVYSKLEFEPLEYKHYNDNKYFCLEDEIICQLAEDISYDQMVIIENDKDLAYNTFKTYIEASIKNNNVLNISINEDGYLFLYKKYGHKYSHNKKKNHNYDVKIKYYLL